jgi:hypothetical protein
MSPAEFDTLLTQLIEDELLHQLTGCSNVGGACDPGKVMTNPMWQLGGMTNQVPREKITKEELLLGSSSSSFEDLEELLNAALQQPHEETGSGATATATTAPLAAAAAAAVAAPGSVAALQQPQEEGVWSMPIRQGREGAAASAAAAAAGYGVAVRGLCSSAPGNSLGGVCGSTAGNSGINGGSNGSNGSIHPELHLSQQLQVRVVRR